MKKTIMILLLISIVILSSCSFSYENGIGTILSDSEGIKPDSLNTDNENLTDYINQNNESIPDETNDFEENSFFDTDIPVKMVDVYDAMSIASIECGGTRIQSIHIPAINLNTTNAASFNKKMYDECYSYYYNGSGGVYKVNYKYQVFYCPTDVYSNYNPSREIIGIAVTAFGKGRYPNASLHYSYYYYDTGKDIELNGKDEYLKALGIHPASIDKAISFCKEFQNVENMSYLTEVGECNYLRSEIKDILIAEENTIVTLHVFFSETIEGVLYENGPDGIYEITVPTDDILRYYEEIIFNDQIGYWWEKD